MYQPSGKDTRINLHVYVKEDGKTLYQTVHVGFFPNGIVGRMLRRIDARGLAYHHRCTGQTGRVDVVIASMAPGHQTEFTEATYDYEPYSTERYDGSQRNGN